MNRARLVRENKPFAVWDLLVYAVIAALLVVLFLVFVVFDVFGTDSARGIRVQVNEETVYTYVFGEGGTVAQGWEDRVEERTKLPSTKKGRPLSCAMPIAACARTVPPCARSATAEA